jgi:spore germination cell wall hydrolase CwlJ-like protein
MTRNPKDTASRCDRVLIAVLAVVLCTASAAVGASITYHPRAQRIAVARAMPAAKPAPAHVADDAVMRQLLAEHRCLSQVMYYEARGEGTKGEEAVAEVVFHRMRHGNYGHSICAVVYEGAGHPGCQFSFTCNGALKEAREPRAWHRAEILAARILTGEVRLHDSTEGATSYHAVSVQPGWAAALTRTTQIGNHVFYRGRVRSRAS